VEFSEIRKIKCSVEFRRGKILLIKKVRNKIPGN
jgi:hypothetical protein